MPSAADLLATALPSTGGPSVSANGEGADVGAALLFSSKLVAALSAQTPSTEYGAAKTIRIADAAPGHLKMSPVFASPSPALMATPAQESVEATGPAPHISTEDVEREGAAAEFGTSADPSSDIDAPAAIDLIVTAPTPVMTSSAAPAPPVTTNETAKAYGSATPAALYPSSNAQRDAEPALTSSFEAPSATSSNSASSDAKSVSEADVVRTTSSPSATDAPIEGVETEPLINTAERPSASAVAAEHRPVISALPRALAQPAPSQSTFDTSGASLAASAQDAGDQTKAPAPTLSSAASTTPAPLPDAPARAREAVTAISPQRAAWFTGAPTRAGEAVPPVISKADSGAAAHDTISRPSIEASARQEALKSIEVQASAKPLAEPPKASASLAPEIVAALNSADRVAVSRRAPERLSRTAPATIFTVPVEGATSVLPEDQSVAPPLDIKAFATLQKPTLEGLQGPAPQSSESIPTEVKTATTPAPTPREADSAKLADGASFIATAQPTIATPQAELDALAAPRTDAAIGSTLEADQIATPAPDSQTSAPPSALSRATIETTAQLAAQISRRLEGRSTRFDMVLTPEDLGRVEVSLEIDADGQLAARLAFDNPAAAADLRGRADELRRQLQDAGFQLSRDALDFAQRDPSAGGGFNQQQQQRNALFAHASRLSLEADVVATPPPGAWNNQSSTRDRVDMRV